MAGIGSLVRNYRFVIGSLTAIMVILLLKSSSNRIDISRAVSPSINRPDAPDDISTLPISSTPGYLGDSKTESKNPDVADAVKDVTTNSGTTEKCEKDHQYVVMVDAGSTGSRVHVYEFDVCTQPPTLIEETFDMLKPGLSSYDTDATGAAKSLDPLLQKAMDVIPKNQRKCSPVAVKATAGLRKLGDAKSEKILAAVRSHLEKDFPFPVVDGKGVSVMDGEDEGVYAWITANYLLGNIGAGFKLPTTAIFDLGGGSTQIVFEPTFKGNEKMAEGEHAYDLTFGGENYKLYQFSHLGYGLMEGRNKINALLVETAIAEGLMSKTDRVATLTSPCLPPGVTAEDEKVVLQDSSKYTITFNGPSEPAGAQCRYLAEKILNKDAKCSVQPCSFNGVHQPSLVRTFKESNDLYVFSYFYDRTQPLGLPSSFTLRELTDLARAVCNGETVWKSVFSGVEGSVSELKKEPQWCLDLSFEVALLHTGYDIPLQRELKTAQTIAGNELGWCLGASLPLINSSDWKCKITSQ
ncbi:LAMI_0D08394g1_1 [Lachancea mirantina]|uniref:Guanosine-diphosphatase n=1 Tax=Lachancea mirantina TaxID=1230905 RepID=A0A1G4JCX7_9SACH|nr:LAMI_0D08394g1_1 [Lachancea mirantina]